MFIGLSNVESIEKRKGLKIYRISMRFRSVKYYHSLIRVKAALKVFSLFNNKLFI